MIIDLPPHEMTVISNIALQQGISLEQFILKSAYEKALELAHTPNAETIQAMNEANSGEVARFNSIDDLMKDLNNA